MNRKGQRRGDVLAPAERSALMSRISGKDTAPELAVRSLVHGLGYRFRLHGRERPGRNGLGLRRRRTASFVRGAPRHRSPDRHVRRDIVDDARMDRFDCHLDRYRRFAVALCSTDLSAIAAWELQLRRSDRVRARPENLLGKRIE